MPPSTDAQSQDLNRGNQALRQSEERQAFLLELSDALRALRTPAEITQVTAERLGEQFGLSRVFYAVCHGSLMKVERDYTRGVPSIAGEHSLEAFGPELLRAYHECPTVKVNDVGTDSRLNEVARSGLQARQVGAYLDVILFDNEQCVSILALQSATPRNWTATEEGLFREVGERAKSALERAHAEAALRESEARLRALTDHLPGGMVYQIATGSDGSERRFLYVSQSHLDLTGIPAAAVIADPNVAYDLIHPDDRAMLGAAEAEAIRTQSPFDVQARFRRADGEQRWCRIISAPRLQDDGSTIWDGLQIDITDEKENELALGESEKRFRRIADSAPVPMWVTQLDRKRSFVNRAYIDFLGISYAEAVDFDWRTIIHPEDCDRIVAESVAGEASLKPFVLEGRYRGGEGEWRWLRSESQPRWGTDGAHSGFIGVAHDITASKQAEATLREARLIAEAEASEKAAILGQLTEGVIVTDAAGKIVFVNEAATRLHGVAALDVAPDDYSETYHLFREDGEPYPFAELPLARAALHGEAIIDARWVIRRPDGSDVFAIGSAKPIRDAAGKQTGAVLTVRDDSARRTAEQGLRETAEELQAVLDAMPAAVWIARDAEGRDIIGNRASYELLRMHTGKNVSLSAADGERPTGFRVFQGDRELAPHELPVQAAARGEEVKQFEEEIRFDDGSTIAMFGNASPLKDAQGKIRGAVAAFVDVTDLKSAEAALRDSESRFREQFENANDFIFTTDLEMKIASANPAVAVALGHSPESLIGRSIGEFVPPHEGARNRDMLAVKLSGAQEATRYDVEVDGPDGVPMIWEINSRLTRDAAGAPNGLHAIGRDITAKRRVESELRESEERFRNMADHAPVMMWVTDPNGYCTYLNARWYEFTGQTPAEAEGYGRLDATHPDDKADAEAAFVAANAARGDFRIEYRLRRADGAYRWAIDAATPRFGLDGEYLGYVGSVIDIDERKEIEDALIDSEGRFRALAQAMPNHVWTATPDGQLDWFNERVYEFSGAAEGSLQGDQWTNLVHRDDIAAAGASWAAALASGERYETAFRLRDGAGNFRWHLARAVPIRDSTGAIARWIGTNTDIDGQKAAEEALRTSEEQFRNLADNMSQFAWTADASGSIHWYNQRWYDYTGTNFDEMQGWGWTKVHHPDHADRIVASFTAKVEAGELWEDVFPLRGADGEYRWFLSRARPIRDAQGAILRWFGTNTDITEQRDAEQALRDLTETLEVRVEERTGELVQAQEALRQSQKLEAMGQLTGGVAHDFNNLLTPIVGSLDMLRRKGIGTEREQRLIDGALQSAERAKTLVQRLLAFARRQPLQASAVDIAALVGGMADLVASTSGPQIKVVVDMPDTLPAARADANQLEMAVLNLSVNARDAMPDGGALTIAAECEAVAADNRAGLEPGSYVRLSVSDTGEGMDEVTLARAVEPFFSTKGIGKGTGLGLSMVHGLASQLGGALTLSSKPGLGTRVELWLPATDEAPGRALEVAATGAGKSAPAGTVLLVDDEPLVRASTADMLSDLGYKVVEAESGKQAIALFGKQRFDMLVTDHLMPGLSGTDLARQLRTQWPDLPVLVVSGYADIDGITPDLPRLTKPFRQADLAASIAAIKGDAG